MKQNPLALAMGSVKFNIMYGVNQDALVASLGMNYEPQLKAVYKGFILFKDRGIVDVFKRQEEKSAINEMKYLSQVVKISDSDFQKV